MTAGVPVGRAGTVRVVLGFVLEALGVLAVAACLWVNFGWSWALLPVAAYLLLLGFTLDRR